MKGPVMSVVVAAVLLGGAAISSRVSVDQAAADAYHERIRESVRLIELNPGVWMGQEVELPPSATKLLRPNAIIARRYQTAERGGVSPTLLVVQCEDIRDMQGHYPPNCYPAHGWSLVEGPGDVDIGGLPGAKYRFSRQSGQGALEIVVYNMFILPNGETTTDMRSVRQAGSDYQSRPFGAAQVQIVFSGDVPEQDRAWVLGEMRMIGSPVIDTLLEGAPEVRGGASR